jgi:capsule polysaccharide modification protein KpsS
MPSPAATKYFQDVEKARILRELASDRRLSPTSPRIEVCRHASLASKVAAWDAYINNLVRTFFVVTTDPLTIKFHALHQVARNIAEQALEKFNTPNWENTRNLLARHTGYDPYNDWNWAGYNSTQVKERLNEILKVRHSFAHGFSIPAYSWTQSATGMVELTDQALGENDTFFENLVLNTDNGMKQHIITTYSVTLTW